MLFQETPLEYLSFFDAIEMGLYFIIVGYFFLLFFYFLFIRYRTSRKLYWLFFSLFFLCFGIARVFFIVYYFFGPELYDLTNGAEVVAFLMINFRLATFFTWMGVACAVGVLGILLFPPETQEENKGKKTLNEWLKNRKNLELLIRIGLFALPIIIGILALTLPDGLFMDPDFIDEYIVPDNIVKITIGSWNYPLGRFLFNFIFMPLFLTLIPFIFLYLAWKTFGVLRKSYALNAIGFILYFIGGRILQGVLDVATLPHLRAIMPPLIILLALLILVIANNYEQLK
ncbi:MAG: hypothetical protein CEE43_02310 [Promethearchaeota archaeon Loki_b32]|nr:MAG: hypothetical protein CEE43_02310 [Candidatus Lokiarchaeota archaeon Loki_b32]